MSVNASKASDKLTLETRVGERALESAVLVEHLRRRAERRHHSIDQWQSHLAGDYQ